MKIRLICPLNNYLNDVQDVARAFSPALMVDGEADNFLQWDYTYSDGIFSAKISSDILGNAEKVLEISDADISKFKKITKRFLKNFLYDFLSEKLNIRLPYGSLTGVRPTKLYYELINEKEPVKILENEFSVAENKAKLIQSCVDNQRGIINDDENKAALFLNIPFCPTRCAYCSFISTEVSKVYKELPLYVECVLKEISAISELLDSKKFGISSIYVGGGTPSSVGTEFLDKLLSPLSRYGVEFTVEAGRPDAIDKDIVEVLKKNNVTRISVNPQTFKQSTLDKIGRKHTVEKIYESYDLVKDLFSVNMDLIAGLPDETTEDFKDSLDRTVALSPDNITVHTLSLKRGSVLTASGAEKCADGVASAMSEYAYTKLTDSGYAPYYMYRQKNMADNLENVGYCKEGKQCAYNIDMMEESITVLGAGAGAMTKMLSGGRIDRASNPKGFREYVERIEDVIDKKRNLFKYNG